MRALLFVGGQGTQCIGMSADIPEAALQTSQSRCVVETADAFLGVSCLGVMETGPQDLLDELSVPLLLTKGVLIGLHLRDASVTMMTGLSFGQFVALVVAGVLEFGVALRLVTQRQTLLGAACAAMPTGMLRVHMDDAGVARLLRERDLVVTNFVKPGVRTLGGPRDVLDEVQRTLDTTVPWKRLNVLGAFHSKYMEPALDEWDRAIRSCPFRWTTGIAIVGNTDAQIISSLTDLRRELVQHIVSPVQWEACVQMCAGLECVVVR